MPVILRVPHRGHSRFKRRASSWTRFGSRLIQIFRAKPDAFRQVATLAEGTVGKRYRGGVNIQEIYEHVETGVQFVRHVIYSDQGNILKESFRQYAK